MAGIYIHIPFCKSRCIYCDFYSTVQLRQRRDYAEALCKELVLRKEELKHEMIQTIYLGGGTPSLLSIEEIKLILETVYHNYQVCEHSEITLEANPDDLSSTYVQRLKSTPVNRLSIGIQTFDDRRLNFLNRRHSAHTAVDAVKTCQQAGFNNISIDLIYGFPDETVEEWTKDIHQALLLEVQHISAYHLMVEEGTALWSMREAGKIVEGDEETSLGQFEVLIDSLEANGFLQYEISNFCRPDYYSRHNSSYWNDTKYLGIGASAHSYLGEKRVANVANLVQYFAGINSGTPEIEVEIVDRMTRYNTLILTSMRTTWGLDLNKLMREFGEEYYCYCLEQADSYLKKGVLLRLPKDDKFPLGTLKLARAGIFISDRIISDLMWVD